MTAKEGSTIVARGTWRATSVTSFTPVSGGGRGGVLVLQVQISTQGGSSSTGSMRIASTGSESGVTLAIGGGATFVPSGVGTVSIRAGSGGGGGDDGGGSDDGAGDDAIGRTNR